jgi:hypothetical protein
MNERVWIFTLSKTLSDEQLQKLTFLAQNFVEGWTAHEQKLSASFELYQNSMLIFKVDEQVYDASGCSIDKLTRVIKQMEQEFSVELLNRLIVAYEDNGVAKVVHSSKIKELLENKTITKDTLVFDNTISSSSEFANWKKPLKDTWLSKYLPIHSS